MVNQVLCHISNTPMDLIKYCQDKGIVMEAYSPVAHGEALKNEKIADMAFSLCLEERCKEADAK